MTQPSSIHMGHGQMVDIVSKGSDTWELVFSEAGISDYKAPPLNEVEVDAIDQDGKIHPLAISAGSNVSSIRASGHVAGAYRARVRVVHGTHFHTREALLPGASPVAPKLSAQGGVLTALDDGTSVEIRSIDPTRWQLTFLRDGAPVAPPSAEAVVVQAVGPRAEDYQIRNLTTETGEMPATLIAGGKIKDAEYARLTVKTNGREQIRSFPIARA